MVDKATGHKGLGCLKILRTAPPNHVFSSYIKATEGRKGKVTLFTILKMYLGFYWIEVGELQLVSLCFYLIMSTPVLSV